MCMNLTTKQLRKTTPSLKLKLELFQHKMLFLCHTFTEVKTSDSVYSLPISDNKVTLFKALIYVIYLEDIWHSEG